MASSSSSAPEKPQPLHNFKLPSELRWNKDGKSGSGSHKRCRSMKSPPPRPNAVPASPLRHSPLRDSVTPPPPPPRLQPQLHESRFQPPLRDFAAPPPRFQHPLREFAAGPSRFQSLLRECTAAPASRESPVVGDGLAKKSRAGEETKQSPIDDELENVSLIREETRRNYRGRDWSSESDDSRKGKAGVIAYTRNPLKKYSAFASPTKLDHGKPEKKSKAAEADLFHRNPLKKSTLSSSPTKVGCSTEIEKKSSKKKSADDDAAGMKKSNLVIKIGSKNSEEVEEIREKAAAKSDSDSDSDSEEEIKVWNLRPRNVVKTKPEILAMAGAGTSSGKKKSQPQKKKEKKELSIAISLTKREIEEDIFALTGAKPSRRPKKRTKNVQKQLDTAFPGLWLLSITPESYKVSESSLKGWMDFMRRR